MATYCWYETATPEKVYGPFDTVAEALADVPENFDEAEDAEIAIAEVKDVLPEDYADVIAVDELLDRMEDAVGEEVETDDHVFETVSGHEKEAEEALADALIAWAKKYVEAVGGTWTQGTVTKTTTVQTIRIALGLVGTP